MNRSIHVPIRTCIGCGARARQAELVRVVSAEDGGLALDASRRAGGRGGYLHRAPACWEQFRQRKGMVRSLARAVQKPARERLIAQLRLVAGA